jgi:hypothetical protein
MPPGRFDVSALALAPDGTVLAGTSSGQLLRSDDGGASWFAPAIMAIPQAMPINALIACAPKADTPTSWRLFAGTDRGVQLYDSARGLWKAHAPGMIARLVVPALPDVAVRSLVMFKGRLVAGTPLGLFHADPVNAGWHPAPRRQRRRHRLVPDRGRCDAVRCGGTGLVGHARS